MINQNKRFCTKCGIEKSFSDFTKDKYHPLGIKATCKPCSIVMVNEYRKLNPEYAKIYMRARRKKLPLENKTSSQRFYKKHPFSRNYRPFTINLDEYNVMLNKQGGVCAICKKKEWITFKGVVRRLAIDHCHKTGKIRGLLCAACNTSLGRLNENPETLFNMIRYINKYTELLPLFETN